MSENKEEKQEEKKESGKKEQSKTSEMKAKLEEKKAEKIENNKEDNKEGLKDSEVIDLNKPLENSSSKSVSNSKKSNKFSNDFIAQKKKKKRIRGLIILAIIVACLVAGFFYIKKKIGEAKDLVEAALAGNMQTAEVEEKTLVLTVPATGNLVPCDSVTLSTILQSSSKIEEVNVEVGDYVEKDDVLVRFSTEDINKEIAQAQEDIASQRQKDAISAEDSERQYINSYVSATNNLKSAAERVDKALKTLHEACNAYGDAKRQLQADKDAGASEAILRSDQAAVDSAYKQQENAQMSYDDAVEAQAEAITNQENSLSNADSTYKSSNLSRGDMVKTSKRQLERLEDSLDNYIVTASISGIVTSVNVTEGNSFSTGSVLTIQDISTMQVEVLVDEYDIPKVKKAYEKAKNSGDELEVEIKTNATEDNKYKGHVISIDPTSTSTATFSTTTVTSSAGMTTTASSGSAPQYKVKVQLDEMDDAFMIGMSAKVSIVVDQSPENSLCVPYNAIEENSEGEFFVSVVIDPEPKDEAKDENGIVVENNTTQKGINNGLKGLDPNELQKKIGDAKNLKDATKALEDAKPETREVKVRKIFDTDYYTAIVPVNANELKAGDTVVIHDDRDGANDLMFMVGGPGMMY